MEDKVIVVGAGLCGTLLAIRMAQRGHQVTVYEKRADMRSNQVSAGRSINLALSDRGLKGLSLAGLEDEILPLVIPMMGRMIHPMEGQPKLVNYSGRQGEWINSVSRGGLNMLLLNKAATYPNIQLVFDTECTGADLENAQIHLKNMLTGQFTTAHGDVILCTDGANSAIRNAYLNLSAKYRFNFSQQYLSTAYKELEIPAASGHAFRLEKNALHIWPRQGFMMIALPNMDGSFTVTLFLPMEGNISFSNLQSDEQIFGFFNQFFSSALEHMPDILEDFRTNPTSGLGTVKCYPWHVGKGFLLLGDAAHAVVPFYGQGMNASFEDVLVLDGIMDKYEGDWEKILSEFQELRKKDADAIADLAIENEIEMRDATADPVFLLKRQIELQLEQKYSDYFSKYSMVTFREDLSYSYAMRYGRQQDRILMDYAAEIKSIESLNEDVIMSRLRAIY